MKKTFRMFGMALMAILLAVSFTACGDDDDDEPADPATHDQELIGSWTYHYEDSDWWETTDITFHANGEFEVNETYWDEEDGKESYWAVGEWETDNGYLTLLVTKCSDRDEIGETNEGSYYIVGNQLRFDGTTFTRK